MSKIQSFEDLLSWQKARTLTNAIYAMSKEGALARDFSLRDQIRRSAVSVMSNIAEGFERGGDKEFRQFLSQAKGSCAELRSQLFIALDQKYLSDSVFKNTKDLSTEVSRLIGGMMNYLANSEFGGSKFRPREKEDRGNCTSPALGAAGSPLQGGSGKPGQTATDGSKPVIQRVEKPKNEFQRRNP